MTTMNPLQGRALLSEDERSQALLCDYHVLKEEGTPMTQKDGIALMNRLQDDPTRKLLGPMAWLTNHRTEVQELVKVGRLREMAQHIGITPSTIQRWMSQHPTTVQEAPAGDSDLSYWRGYASAMERAFETLCRYRVQA